jgi:hypothetical protein
MWQLLAVPAACLLAVVVTRAQTRFSYSSGLGVSPAYEGWMPNDDGSFTMYFGYMNTNWQQELDVSIGPANTIDPGGPDQGQPTHFYPRRNPFLFTIKVPKDFGKKELIWTLTSSGKTEHAYASLKSDYEIDKQVISTEVGGDNGSLRDALRTNIPPELSVEGDKQRTVKVGQPLTLAVIAGDPDNLPARRDGRPAPGMRASVASAARGAGAGAAAAPARGAGVGAAAAPAAERLPAAGGRGAAAQVVAAPRPTNSVVASSGAGLRFSWTVYRGNAASVSFSPDQMKAWMDTRPYANSAWSPPYTIPVPPADGRWVAEATFAEPGTYLLRGVASDGSLFTYENVTVTVTR